jgi:hypothetical protein
MTTDPDKVAREIAEQFVMPGYSHSLADAIASAIRTAVAEEREAIATQCDENAAFLRQMIPKLKANGHHAHAELTTVRAEQTEGIAAAIRSKAKPPATEKKT